MMNSKVKAWLWFAVGLALIGLALFLCAGTMRYWQAWVYLGAVAVSSGLLTLYTVKDPILLENRTRAGPVAEQRGTQKIIVGVAGLSVIATYVVSALDHRFGWSSAPPWLSILGDLLILVSMGMVYRVFRENSFGSATVEISKNQRVVSTGPYAIVRHPMYSSAAVYVIGVAFALASYGALIPAILTIFALVWRLLDEEKFLAENLRGYREYCDKVRWRLVPGIY